MDGITDLTDMSLSKLWKIVKDKEAWSAVVLEVAVRYHSATEQQVLHKTRPKRCGVISHSVCH